MDCWRIRIPDFSPQRQDDPPFPTNGVIVREIDIRHVKYRFLDSSGFYTHTAEWQRSVNASDAALVLVSGIAVQDGLFFTREFFEHIAPFIDKRKIPIYILVNQAKENQSFENLDRWIQEFFADVPHGCSSITTFGNEVYAAFEWFEGHVVAKLKRK
jgi:hypothetical protein